MSLNSNIYIEIEFKFAFKFSQHRTVKMLKIIGFLLILTNSARADFKASLYHQSVNIPKYENVISQGFLRLDYQEESYDIYGALYYDTDTQSDKDQTYTDKQISPALGIQSKILVFNSRVYGEIRDVNRQGKFSDERSNKDSEARFGAIGYDMKSYSSLFTEWYYNLFYSKLYDDQIILQAWHKHGFTYKYFSVFNEILIDSFDLTKQEQSTVDTRPGLRLQLKTNSYLIQLLTQYLIPIDNSGRDNEIRSTLVLYISL